MKSSNDKAIVIEINHFPKINLYKNLVKRLDALGIEIIFILRPRGNLVEIFKKEYEGRPYVNIGHHRTSVAKKILDLIIRNLELVKYLRNKDFYAGFGSYSLTQALFLLRRPGIILFDDPEYKFVYHVAKLTATWMVVPIHLDIHGKNVLRFKGFKELAYLHPNFFHPNEDSLRPYGVHPEKYVFLREVSNSSINYRSNDIGKLSTIIDFLNSIGYECVLSLEDKSIRDLFKNKCIILEEPVEDIHSLLYYAALTIASGDSMARESCLLGTPAIYTGGRDMKVNHELIEKGCFFKVDEDKDIRKTIEYIVGENIKENVKKRIETAIKEEWDDPTQVMLDIFKGVSENDESLIDKYREVG